MAEGKKVFTLKDVSSHDFVVEYAQHLKKTGKMDVPKWVDIAKTGPFKELAPYDEDFYYIRAGALAPPGGSGVGAGGRWGGCGTPRSGLASEPPLPASRSRVLGAGLGAPLDCSPPLTLGGVRVRSVHRAQNLLAGRHRCRCLP